jgi:hypothetical protein
MAFMEPIRPLRKADEWLKVLKQRVTLLGGLLLERCPSDTIAPCVIDLYSRLDIRAILERPLDDKGQDNVDEASFAVVLADFDALVAGARTHRAITLLAAMRTNSKTPDAITEADLDRPTSLFKCGSSYCVSNSVMNTATASVHRCENDQYRYSQTRPMGMAEWNMTDALERMHYICRAVEVCGGPATFVVDTHAMARATRIIELVGIYPACTVADLDAIDPWFSCSCYSCNSPGGFHATKPAISWRHLVRLQLRVCRSCIALISAAYRLIAITTLGPLKYLVFWVMKNESLPLMSAMPSNLC